jgi:membrane-bound inhibitor of C-type lysozyme
METAIEKALKRVKGKSIKVDKIEKPKESKSKDVPIAYACDKRPFLYLNDKEFTSIPNLTVGDKVVLVVECEVKSVSNYSSLDDKNKPKQSYNCDLAINAISDITE